MNVMCARGLNAAAVALAVLGLASCGGSKAAQKQDSAAAAPVPLEELVAQVLELSGMNVQLANVEPGIEQTARANPVQPPDNVMAQLRETYSGPALQAGMKALLVRDAQRDPLEKAVAWYGSALGRKTVQLETAVSTPGGLAGLEAFVKSAQEPLGSPERMGLLKRWERGSGYTETVVNAGAAALRPWLVLEASRAGLPPEAVQPRVEQAVSRMKAATRQQLEKVTLASWVYMYRSLSDDEVRANVAFIESDAGRWLAERLQAAMIKVLEDAGNTFLMKVSGTGSL